LWVSFFVEGGGQSSEYCTRLTTTLTTADPDMAARLAAGPSCEARVHAAVWTYLQAAGPSRAAEVIERKKVDEDEKMKTGDVVKRAKRGTTNDAVL